MATNNATDKTTFDLSVSGTFQVPESTSDSLGIILWNSTRFMAGRIASFYFTLGEGAGADTAVTNATFVGWHTFFGSTTTGANRDGAGTSVMSGAVAQAITNVAFYGYAAYASAGAISASVGVGSGCGENIGTGAQNNQVYIGSGGVNSETNIVRVGVTVPTGMSTPLKCFIGGILGSTATSGINVLVDSAHQLGTVSSSIRYKENIQTMPASYSATIYDLKPSLFSFKKHPYDVAWGLIAEEVDEWQRDDGPVTTSFDRLRMSGRSEVGPRLCVYDQGEPEAVQYHMLPSLLLNEIQKLGKRMDRLEVSIL